MKHLVFMLVLLVARLAHADVTVEAVGQGAGYDTQPEVAVGRANKDAIRQAVDQVVSGLVTPADRKAHAEAIKNLELRRAQVYVRSQRVMDQGLVEGLWQVHLEVTVDDVQLAKDLVALKIPVTRPGGEPTPSDPGRPRVAVIIVLDGGGQAAADLGGLVARELAARGIDVAKVLTVEAPRDDAQAAELARQASAPRALLVNASARPAGRIRGTPLAGVEVAVVARVIAVDPVARLDEQSTRTGGAGKDEGAARGVALASAAAFCGTIFEHGPRPQAAGGRITVRLMGVTRWQEPQAVIKALLAVPGVSGVVVGELQSGSVTLVIEGATQPGALARVVPVGQARVTEGRVEVMLPVPGAAVVPERDE